MSAIVERLAPFSRRANAEPLQIEPLAVPVDALAFVNDPVTAEILAALFGATGQGRVQFGGLNAAIQVLQSAPCPQLLVIDIAGLSDPIGHLDRLADLCPEGTGVVLVGGPQTDSLAAELRAMGVTHYLPRPIDAEQMRAAILAASGNGAQMPNDGPATPFYDAAEPRTFAPLGDEPARADHDSAEHDSAEHDSVEHESVQHDFVTLNSVDDRPFQAETGPAPAPDSSFPSTADPLPYSRQAPPQGPAPAPPPAQQSVFMPAAPAYAAITSATGASTDPFSEPVRSGPGIPPPATTQMGQISGLPFAPTADVEPLARPVDLLAFLTEAQSASIVASIIGPHGAAGRVQPGGINAAIAFLRDNASPKILLVDISGVPEPMSRIDALAEVCAPGTMVVATGVANDVSLYRDLKNAGIYEYLVKPLQPEVLKSVVVEAASGGARPEAEAGKPVLMVIGTRGGVGASTIAINIAGTLAKQGRKTILLDLDLQFGSVALTLDIDPGHGLREALDRPERVDSMFLNSSAVKVADNLFVLAAEEAVNEAVPINGESLVLLMHELQRHFDALVIDMPRHVATGNWEAIGHAHSVLLVADLSLVGIRDTTRILTASKDAIEPAKLKLLISSTGSDRGAKIDRKEFEAALNRKADYVLPEDAKSVSAANRAGRTVVDVAGGSKLSTALRDLCVDIIGKPGKPGSPVAEVRRKRSVISLFSRKPKA